MRESLCRRRAVTWATSRITSLTMDDEEIFACDTESAEFEFDEVVGVLEEILISEKLAKTQTSFCKDHAHIFEDDDENKHVYLNLFEEYSELMESHIAAKLSEAITSFDMQDFMSQLAERRDEITGDVFDLLLGLSDFDEFKQMMLAYKRGECVGIRLDINFDGDDRERKFHK